MACVIRFSLLDEAQDLETAVRFSRRALKIRPAGHPHRDDSLLDLASNLRLRLKMIRDEADAAEAMELLEELQALHPFGHPLRAPGMHEMAMLVF